MARQHTSAVTKAQIVDMWDRGVRPRDIATQVNVACCTVYRIQRRYGESKDFYTVAPKSGRPRKFTRSDAIYAARLLTRGKAQNASELARRYFPEVSAETIRVRLAEVGLYAYARRKVPLLTKKQRWRRLYWAKKLIRRLLKWADRIIFSDESRFQLFGSDGRRYCYRKPGQALDPRFTDKRVKHGGGNIMVWGCITRNGVGRLVRINGTMRAQYYTEILQEGLLGTLRDKRIDVRGALFQQDNDPKHTSRLAKQWLTDNSLSPIPWPSNSPDMNIIEHVWHYLDRRVRQRPNQPHNLDALWEALQEEWYRIDQEFLDHLYNSIPRRVDALVAAKGGNTRY